MNWNMTKPWIRPLTSKVYHDSGEVRSWFLGVNVLWASAVANEHLVQDFIVHYYARYSISTVFGVFFPWLGSPVLLIMAVICGCFSSQRKTSQGYQLYRFSSRWIINNSFSWEWPLLWDSSTRISKGPFGNKYSTICNV